MRRPDLRLELAPTWTHGPNPHAAPFASGGRLCGRTVSAPFARDVRATKGSAAYRAHMYHTKVPPEGIEPYIKHYTAAGETVLDPFCGSGMTGVAAVRLGRRALLSDLSPFATFLAYNHCAPCGAGELRAVLEGVLERALRRVEPLYGARCPSCGAMATTRHVVWSDVLRCPECGARYALWDAAVDSKGRVRREYECPGCGRRSVKRLADRVGSEPVAAAFDCPNGCDAGGAPLPADQRSPGTDEWSLITDHLWRPTDPIPSGLDELSRVRRSGVATVGDLFTPRNLAALSVFWAEAAKVEPAPLRARALFAVTAIMVRASRLVKYIPSRRMIPGPILGTMYLPSLSGEVNVLELFRRRIERVCAAAEDLRPARGADSVRDLCISTQSAANLRPIPDGSIDYVFTDPPFGGNIQYSELNFMWENWFGWRTDAAEEAVVNRSQGKGVGDYGELMAAAFGEIHRVLRHGRWMTLVFHNTRAEVWAAIQRGVERAGFSVEAVQTLDKSHETFKQVTAAGAVGYDVVVNCRKQAQRRLALKNRAEPVKVLHALLAAAPRGPCRERTARYLHARLTGELLRTGAAVTLDYKDVLRLLREHFRQDGRYWTQ